MVNPAAGRGSAEKEITRSCPRTAREQPPV